MIDNKIDPSRPSGLDYYPLARPGERFPVADPAFPPRLTPRPKDDAVFLQGLFEGMARIEAQGYRLLEALGAPSPALVLGTGGGAHNRAWNAIRSHALGVPTCAAIHADAAYGAALLAKYGENLLSYAQEDTAQ